jgi:magnesium-transporting ATPase (P-type)
VLVDYDKELIHLEDLLAEVAHLELPLLPEQDEPIHPLDPRPLVRSATCAIGALLGLTYVTIQGVIAPVAVAGGLAAAAAGVLNLVQAFPGVRGGLRRLLGDNGATVASHGVAIVAMTAAEIPLGLVLAGAEALLLLGVVTERRAAWRRYENCLDTSRTTTVGAALRLEPGMRVPRGARVIEGTGTAISRSGRTIGLAPGLRVPGGARVMGGPFVVELLDGEPFEPEPRSVPPDPDLHDRYLQAMAPASFAYAVIMGLATGSVTRGLEALLLVNPHPALVGAEAANLSASARALRAGLTIVGSRPKRTLRLPDAILLDGPRLLTDGKEVDLVLSLFPAVDNDTLLTLAASVGVAAGAPLGMALQAAHVVPAVEGSFDGHTASARINRIRYTLRTAVAGERRQLPGGDVAGAGLVVALDREGTPGPLGLIRLRPRLVGCVTTLVEVCRRHGVELAVLPGREPTMAERITDRAGVTLLPTDDAAAAIRERQARGLRVAFVSDGEHAGQAFAQCDLAIGMAAGHHGYFPAQADFLAPDLTAVADFIDAGGRRETAVRDGVVLSTLCNVLGLALSLQGPIGIHVAFIPGYVAALGAMASGIARLRGGWRPEAVLGYMVEPRPERWGHRPVPKVLEAFHTRPEGLSSAAAARRLRPRPASQLGEEFLAALDKQYQSPSVALLAAGACLTLVLGQPLHTVVLSTALSINVVAGMWRERRASLGREAVRRLGSAQARVLRDGRPVLLSAAEVVPGDVIVLHQGDRIPADARLIEADSVEVSEATLTGQSLPVAKNQAHPSDQGRIVLEGSDVLVGGGRAVVVAVGQHTRMKAMAVSITVRAERTGPLDARLSSVLRVALPAFLAGGAVTGAAVLAYGSVPILEGISLGISTALATIPAGLPVVAGIGQSAAATRLARHHTLTRRLSGIEALGRVDIACVDKTGTLTEGHLSLCLIANLDEEAGWPGQLADDFLHVLRIGGLACPHPDHLHLLLHPTDSAVVHAAHEAGLGDELRVLREAEVPFEAARGFHCAAVVGRICIKGAPERIAPRCTRIGGTPIDDTSRSRLLERANQLAARGLRILLVAEGPGDTAPHDPNELDVVGFLGLTDRLRPSVPETLMRCQRAGVRVMMITGDHLATARTIGKRAGLCDGDGQEAVTAAEILPLPAAALDERLKRVAIVARATPEDKVKIIESLNRSGHTVAFTGDGINDAPALHRADVGLAMGRSGTEAAQQAADVVLADDEFAQLAEALVEGRGLWRNMRHVLGQVLGGNAAELSLVAGAACVGLGAPLAPAQVLLIGLMTDILPPLATAMQAPGHLKLSLLTREGLLGLDSHLRRDVVRHALATGVPTLGAYGWMHAAAGPVEAGAVAFASLIGTQLAQALEAGKAQGLRSRIVVATVGGTLATLGLGLGVPPLCELFGLVAPSGLGWGAVAASSVAAAAISRGLGVAGEATWKGWLSAWQEAGSRLTAPVTQRPQEIV